MTSARREALRAQKEAEAKRNRLNRILIVAFALVAGIIIVFVGFFVIKSLDDPAATGNFTPPNGTDYGIKVYPDKAAADAPKVVIWEDFQCGHCELNEKHYGKLFDGLAEKGKISLEYRFIPMLDGPGSDRSLKTSASAALADRYGKFNEYREEVFANYPNYSDELLRDAIPEKIGLTEEQRTEFAKLYNAKVAEKFVKGALDKFMADGVGGTPKIFVNDKPVSGFWTGKKFDIPTITDEEALLKLLTK